MTNEEITLKLVDLENRIGIAETNIDDMKKIQDELQKLVLSVNNLTTSVKHQSETISEIKTDLKKEQAKDGETWGKVKFYVITTIIGLTIGIVFAKLV